MKKCAETAGIKAKNALMAVKLSWVSQSTLPAFPNHQNLKALGISHLAEEDEEEEEDSVIEARDLQHRTRENLADKEGAGTVTTPATGKKSADSKRKKKKFVVFQIKIIK